MTRQEAMEIFFNQDVKEESNRILIQMETGFRMQKEELADSFGKQFKEACRQIVFMQETGQMGQVQFLMLVLYRTRLSECNMQMDFIAANQDWWLDENRKIVGAYDYAFLTTYWAELKKCLEQRRKKYVGRTIPQDVERFMQEKADKFLEYAGRIAKYKILEWTEEEDFKKIKTTGHIDIFVGEYMDYAELIYRERRCERTEEEQKELEERLESKKQEILCFEDLKGSDYSGRDFTGADFRFADFRNSLLENTDFRYSLLIGTIFKGGLMDGADFRYCMMNEANFENCSMKNCLFCKSAGKMGLENESYWDTAGYFGINFRNADLTGADFTGCNLDGADFTGACLKDARFDRKTISHLKLSDGQKKQIYLIEKQEEGT